MASSLDNNTTASNSTAAGGQYFYDEGTSRFNPTNAAVIISLVGGCLVLAFVSVILRKYLRRAAGVTTLQSNTAQSNATQSGGDAVKPKGLQKVDLDALPLVHREDFDEADAPHECPVCLSNFEPEDSLRLLPTCKHVFHRECIDAWFDAHSTCPLCRASLVAESAGGMKSSSSGGEPVAAVGGHGEPVETITEVSESGDSSDIESRQQHPSNSAPIEDSRSSTLISREDSVPGALLRNSESFKHVTIDSDQQPNTKNANFRKPPASPSIRRSSSLSADLIALRNLLMRQSDQNVDGPTRRWFSRARSLDMASRDRSEGDDWVTIDLETGTAANNPDAQHVSSSSRSSEAELPKGPSERAWSDRWSLVSMKDAMISPLTRSTSDGTSRSAHLPI